MKVKQSDAEKMLREYVEANTVLPPQPGEITARRYAELTNQKHYTAYRELMRYVEAGDWARRRYKRDWLYKPVRRKEK